jgi:ribosomal protein L37E
MFIRCRECGELTWTIRGWADLDHCASCGRPLTEEEPAEAEPAQKTSRRRRWDPDATREIKDRS